MRLWYRALVCLLAFCMIAGALVSCQNGGAGAVPLAISHATAANPEPLSSADHPKPQPSAQPERLETTSPPAPLKAQPQVDPSIQVTSTPTALPTLTPTPFAIDQLFDLNIDLKSAPVELALELRIPALDVNAPLLGVGLKWGNVMDAPTGPVGDPVWHSAFWYRGSGIPGQSGTATIGGHVTDPLSAPEIFARIHKLQAGDLIIIHVKNSFPSIDLIFLVDEVRIYSIEESSNLAVLRRIFGTGPIAGTKPQPSSDGLSHLTLITCAGELIDGQFDHHTVVYATLRK